MNNVIVSCPSQQKPTSRSSDKQPILTTPEFDEVQSSSNWSFDASMSSLDSTLSSTIYNAVHLADDIHLTDLEDNSFNLEMAQDAVSECQGCVDKDDEIRKLREKVDELQYLGNQCY